MSAENKVPAIRFKGFSGEWVKSCLGDLCEETYGGGTPKTSIKEYWDGNIPWIQSSDLRENQVVNIEARKNISEIALKKSATKLIPENSIAIVTRVGVGKVSLMQKGYATSQDFLSMSKLKVSPLYAVYSIWKKLQREKLSVQGTSIKGITKEELLSKIINVPVKEKEQTKIGNYFQQLDTLIAQHQQKHDKLLNLKKALLEKMFPKQGATVPEIRFKGFSGEWSVCELGKNSIIKGRLGWKSLKQNEYLDEGPSMIAGRHITDGVIDWNRVDHIPEWRYFESPEIMLKNDDVIFSKDGSLGNPAIIKNLNGYATINSTMMLVRPGKKLVSDFFFQVLKTKTFDVLIKLKVSGSSIPHLFQADMNEFSFDYPAPKEQTKIGNLFKQFDTLIAHHQTQLKKLNNIKQACLEKMFV